MKTGLMEGILAVALLSLPITLMGAAPDEQDAKFTTGPAGIYDRSCGYCHGQNVGPSLLGRGLNPAVTKAMVRTGVGAMPAFKQTEIPDAALDELAQWIERSTARQTDHGR